MYEAAKLDRPDPPYHREIVPKPKNKRGTKKGKQSKAFTGAPSQLSLPAPSSGIPPSSTSPPGTGNSPLTQTGAPTQEQQKRATLAEPMKRTDVKIPRVSTPIANNNSEDEHFPVTPLTPSSQVQRTVTIVGSVETSGGLATTDSGSEMSEQPEGFQRKRIITA
jgi:hypothetical protein